MNRSRRVQGLWMKAMLAAICGKSDVVYLEVGDRRPGDMSPTRTMTRRALARYVYVDPDGRP
jgi:hypothetical protein